MEYFSILLSRWDWPAPVEILWLHRSLALPSRNTPWKFQLNTYKTFENIAVTWTPPQIKANWPARPISDLYFTWFWLINVAKLYMYLPAYLPGVSIQVCRVCMLNMNARYLMVTHLQGFTGQVSVSLNVEYFSNLLSRWDWPAPVEILWLHRSLALPSRNTPWKFQLNTYKTFENIAVTWTPRKSRQIDPRGLYPTYISPDFDWSMWPNSTCIYQHTSRVYLYRYVEFVC